MQEDEDASRLNTTAFHVASLSKPDANEKNRLANRKKLRNIELCLKI
jgi:hypothetical protein